MRIMRVHLELSLIIIVTGLLFVSCGEEGSSSASSTPSRSQGGSTARLTIVEDYLYTLSGDNIQVFDVENPADPKVWNQIDVAWMELDSFNQTDLAWMEFNFFQSN